MKAKDYGRFKEAVDRWISEGEINLKNNAQAKKLSLLMIYLNRCEVAEFYDDDLNGLSFDEIIDAFNLQLDAPEYKAPSEVSYQIVEIHSFDDLQKYERWTNDWCITISDIAFEEHSAFGENTIQLFLRSDYRKVPKKPGDTFPNDTFGNSIFCVIRKPDGSIDSITNRWNADACPENEMEMFLKSLVLY